MRYVLLIFVGVKVGCWAKFSGKKGSGRRPPSVSESPTNAMYIPIGVLGAAELEGTDGSSIATPAESYLAYRKFVISYLL
jgi:hypothetical protein